MNILLLFQPLLHSPRLYMRHVGSEFRVRENFTGVSRGSTLLANVFSAYKQHERNVKHAERSVLPNLPSAALRIVCLLFVS